MHLQDGFSSGDVLPTQFQKRRVKGAKHSRSAVSRVGARVRDRPRARARVLGSGLFRETSCSIRNTLKNSQSKKKGEASRDRRYFLVKWESRVPRPDATASRRHRRFLKIGRKAERLALTRRRQGGTVDLRTSAHLSEEKASFRETTSSGKPWQRSVEKDRLFSLAFTLPQGSGAFT